MFKALWFTAPWCYLCSYPTTANDGSPGGRGRELGAGGGALHERVGHRVWRSMGHQGRLRRLQDAGILVSPADWDMAVWIDSLFVCLSVPLSVCLFPSLAVSLSVSVCLSVCLSVSLSISLSLLSNFCHVSVDSLMVFLQCNLRFHPHILLCKNNKVDNLSLWWCYKETTSHGGISNRWDSG